MNIERIHDLCVVLKIYSGHDSDINCKYDRWMLLLDQRKLRADEDHVQNYYAPFSQVVFIDPKVALIVTVNANRNLYPTRLTKEI